MPRRSSRLRIGAEDAPLIAAHLGLEPDVQTSGMGMHETAPEKLLLTLPNYAAWVRAPERRRAERSHVRGDAAAAEADQPPAAPADHQQPGALRARARNRGGQDRAVSWRANVAAICLA